MTKVHIKDIFTTNRVTKAILHILSYMLIFITLEVLLIHSMFIDTYKDNRVKLNNIVKTEGIDLNLMCNVVGCKAVAYNNTVYLNKSNILQQSDKAINTDIKLCSNLNTDFDSVVESNGAVFIVENTKFFNLTYNLLLYSSSIFFFFITFIYISKLISEYKSSILEKGGLRIELESKLQRDITESLHHEIGNPLAILDALLEDLYRHLYPCNITDDGVCDFKTEYIDKKICVKCPKKVRNRQIDTVAIDHYYKMKFSLDRLHSIQNLVAGSKHIKYSNGTVSIYEIIDNIVSTNNSFKVTKIKVAYNESDIELFKYYACGYGLANGELLLVLHAMITNSIEAKSSLLTFSIERDSKVSDKMMIIIEDNGRGIRNPLGEVIKDTDIFNYGYSTKDPNGENIKITSWFKKLLFKLGLLNEVSTRGVGLSVNKRILENSGGDIELVSTSSQGTKFRVTIPIKIRRNT